MSLRWREDDQVDRVIASDEADTWMDTGVAVAAFTEGCRHIAFVKEEQYFLHGVGKDMQGDAAVRPGGAAIDGADQSGFETGEELHGAEGLLAKTMQVGGVLFAAEQALVLDECSLDLCEFRQLASADAQSRSSLAPRGSKAERPILHQQLGCQLCDGLTTLPMGPATAIAHGGGAILLEQLLGRARGTAVADATQVRILGATCRRVVAAEGLGNGVLILGARYLAGARIDPDGYQIGRLWQR